MKAHKYLFVIIILSLESFSCIAQNWLWARNYGNLWQDNASFIDVNMDIYIGGHTAPSSTYTGLFISKYNLSGNPEWDINFGGSLNNSLTNNISDIVSDYEGKNIYACGYFTNQILIDTILVDGNNNIDLYFTKIDSSGHVQWVIDAGDDSTDVGTSMAVDSAGNVYLMAVFRSEDTLSGIPVVRGSILAKYNSNGNCLWARKIGENIYGLLKLKNNEIYIAGNIKQDADSFKVGSSSFITKGPSDIFISKFDTSGNFIWAKSQGWYGYDLLHSFDVDQQSNLYICGRYSDSTIIGTDTLRDSEVYFAKFDSAGSYQWSKNYGNWYSSVSVDLNNDIYVSGVCSDTIVISGNTILPNAYILKFNPAGAYLGIILFSEGNLQIDCDSIGRIVACGGFSNSITTSSGTIVSHGQLDAFVAMHDAITGEEEIERHSENSLEIFANPTNGLCNIKVPDELLNGNYHFTLKLYDSKGNLLQSEEITPQTESLQLNLEQEAKGIYLVTLTDGKKKYSGRVVFQ
jgi:hypothetical protein